MNQHGFTWLQTGSQEQRVPNREGRFRQRGGMHEIESARQRQHGRRMRYRVFRVTTTGQQSTHRLAYAVGRHAFPQFGHLAGHFQTRNIGNAGRRRVRTAALEDIRHIDAGGGNPNQ